MPATALHDFDFLIGRWSVTHRRLARRLQASEEWETFGSTSTVWALPGGVANFDTLVAEDWRPGWVGMSYRIYDPRADRWSIYWMTNEGGGLAAATGHLDPPVVGRFQGDEGVFEGDDTLDGRPVRVRYRWLRRGPAAARWEQSFSADGGQTWETNWVMDFERLSAEMVPWPPTPTWTPVTAQTDCEVIELRQYTLHPGQRDTLVDLFDTEFVETQEAEGMAVLGQFRDLDAPDRFVWLRGFERLATRAAALSAFYGGPVWQRHRDAANATMVDSDDVRLLRPAWPGAGIRMAGRRRAAGPVRMSLAGQVSGCVLPLRDPGLAATPALRSLCQEAIAGLWAEAGAEVLGWYVTEPARNDFPRLPVREGEPVLVGFAQWPAVRPAPASLDALAGWPALQARLAPWLDGAVQWLRLSPTARSALHA